MGFPFSQDDTSVFCKALWLREDSNSHRLSKFFPVGWKRDDEDSDVPKSLPISDYPTDYRDHFR